MKSRQIPSSSQNHNAWDPLWHARRLWLPLRAGFGVGGAVVLTLSIAVASACGTSDEKRNAMRATDGGGGGVGGAAEGAGAPGSAEAGHDATGGASGAGGASEAAGATAGGAGEGGLVAPTVVATFDSSPESLALDGTNLYVTIPSSGNLDGKVQTVSKTAVEATTGDGTIMTLASDLTEPTTVSADGTRVYWYDRETVFPGGGQVFSVSKAGGEVTQITQGVTPTNRLAIADAMLYVLTGNYGSVTAFPLTGAGGGEVVYDGPVFGLRGIDTDGTSVFVFSGIGDAVHNTISIYKIPAGGGAVTDLMQDVSSDGSGSSGGDCDLLDDDDTLYWTDARNGGVYSVPKTGGQRKLLATFLVNVNGVCPEIALDGDNIYVLEGARLFRLRKAGGTPVLLNDGGATRNRLSTGDIDVGMAIDDTYVYWLRKETAQIVKIAK
jgi:hypothetical protein